MLSINLNDLSMKIRINFRFQNFFVGAFLMNDLARKEEGKFDELVAKFTFKQLPFSQLFCVEWFLDRFRYNGGRELE
jgi:hypothetical protein